MKKILLLILSSVALAGCGGPTNYGDTNIESRSGTSSRCICAQAITVTTQGTLQSISVYITSLNGGGNLQVGIYNDSVGNPGNCAGTLVASSGIAAAQVGWNTVLFKGVFLSAGTYWLAFQDSTGAPLFAYGSSAGKFIFTPNTFGTFPGTYPLSPSTAKGYYFSLYATVVGGGLFGMFH
jgi:hypothetical protein